MMTITIRRCAGIALACALSASAIAADSDKASATTLLHQALEAQGGEKALRAVRNMQWTFAGYRSEIEQSERPEGPYVTELDTISETHDYAGNRYRDVTDAKIYPVFQFSHGTVTTADISMRLTDGKKSAGKPEQIRIASERMALSPERVLLTALDARDVHREADTVLQSVPQNVIAFTLDAAPATIYLNAYTHLPTAVDYSGPLARAGFWAFLGDVTARTWYGFWWLAKGGIHLPMQWTMEGNGLADRTLIVKNLQIDADLKEDDFAVPGDVRAQYKPDAAPTSWETLPLGQPATELAPGIVFIPGAWNVTLVKQDDGIVILEAPISSGYSAKVIAEAHRRFPGQPIKAVITTSDSWPHLSGIREYVAEGIPVYALDLDKPILKRVIDQPHTSKPDRLQESPREPIFHLVQDKLVLDSKINRMEIYPLRGETTERQLMVYFPKQKFVYGSDAFQRNPDNSFNLPQTVSELVDAVKREHLDVTQYFMMHMGLSPWDELQKVIETAEATNSPSGID